MKGLQAGDEAEAARTYRDALEGAGCKVVSERKNLAKHRVALVFHTPHTIEHEFLEDLLEKKIPEQLKGVVDWDMS